jgi:mono/diheme cytochrome c family protein
MNVSASKIAVAAVLIVIAAMAALTTAAIVNAADDEHAESPPSVTKARDAVGASLQLARFAADPPDAETTARGRKAWGDVYKVLMSPRCMNCHPVGDRPLQTDESRPHAMNISRKSLDNGLRCATCHRDKNADELGVPGGPPGAPHWGLPAKEMPLIFEGRSERELCLQMKRPGDNAYKSLDQLMHHVTEDPLVLWGWEPGGDRTKPPLSHEAFVEAFDAWVASGGACPE